MERIKSLNIYQKSILLVLTAMLAIFTAVYLVVASRSGFEYKGAILQPQVENESTLYTGRMHGKDAVFTVTPDKTVTFNWGDKCYGPYTAHEDPSAKPDDELADLMTGIEIRQGADVFFRGGVMKVGGDTEMLLFDEDGSLANLEISYTTQDGLEHDSDGNVIDKMAPTPTTVLRLMDGPKLVSKGAWEGWFGGVFLSLLTAALILFADELFRFDLSFRIREVDRAEPSEWELLGRYVSWTILPVMALVLYIMGLTA